jgi:hypothetical protein
MVIKPAVFGLVCIRPGGRRLVVVSTVIICHRQTGIFFIATILFLAHSLFVQ